MYHARMNQSDLLHAPGRVAPAIGAWLALSAMIVVCYRWIDAPVARFAAGLPDGIAGGLRAVSEFGSAWGWIIGSIAVGLTGWRMGRIALTRRAAFMLTSVLISGLLVNAMKFLAHRPRPDQFIAHGRWGFGWRLGWPTEASFPSGHVTTITAAMACMALFLPRHRWVWIAVVGMVAAGRVASNWHFVSDVIGGVLLGWTTVWAMRAAMSRRGAAL
jgi:membrane-associated phospholipid phosphatase